MTEEDKTHLQAALDAAYVEISELKDKLKRTERQLDRSNKLYDEIKEKKEKLEKKLKHYKRSAKRSKKKVSELETTEKKDVECQVYSDLYDDDGDTGVNVNNSDSGMQGEGDGLASDAKQDWREGPAEGVSIAESLKEAAQEAMQQTGFVFDEATGLYYDHSSGYYYDSEKSLYYDPNSGTYFYYDEDKGAYEFHSQVDIKKLKAEMSREGRIRRYPPGERPKRVPKPTIDAKESAHNEITKSSASNSHKLSKSKEVCHTENIIKNKHKKRRKEVSGNVNGQKKASPDVSSIVEKDAEGESVENSNEAMETEEELEEGELSDSDSSCGKEEMEADSDEEHAANYPPCIRAMVLSSENLDVGSLYIITCSGATVGRENNLGHAIVIGDEQVSKMHCDIHYCDENKCYMVKDHASQNGTFLNGQRIAKAKVMGADTPLKHRDILKLGNTTLDLHIHPGTDTCNKCEPGLVQAELKPKVSEVTVVSKEDKEKQRRREMKNIKKKFGLEKAHYEDDGKRVMNSKYEDKAESRRKKVGSDNPYQPDAPPASVHRPISQDNKGHKMMKKMGWSEGDTLGTSQQGLQEPIQVNLRASQSAGLGSGQYETSMDNAASLASKSKWTKAQQRYHQSLEQAAVNTPQVNEPNRKPVLKFVQGETVKFNLATSKSSTGFRTPMASVLDTQSSDEETEADGT